MFFKIFRRLQGEQELDKCSLQWESRPCEYYHFRLSMRRMHKRLQILQYQASLSILLNLILRNICKVSAHQSIAHPISLLQKLWKSIVNLTWKKSMNKVDFCIPVNVSGPAITCFPKFYQDVKLIVKHCFEFSGVKNLGS